MGESFNEFLAADQEHAERATDLRADWMRQSGEAAARTRNQLKGFASALVLRKQPSAIFSGASVRLRLTRGHVRPRPILDASDEDAVAGWVLTANCGLDLRGGLWVRHRIEMGVESTRQTPLRYVNRPLPTPSRSDRRATRHANGLNAAIEKLNHDRWLPIGLAHPHAGGESGWASPSRSADVRIWRPKIAAPDGVFIFAYPRIGVTWQPGRHGEDIHTWLWATEPGSRVLEPLVLKLYKAAARL